MSQQNNHIEPKIKTFIEKQPLFFVATAACDGRINLSPKGLDSLRVIDSNTVVWLNYTGSGNETAAHILLNDRMTIMFCSFDKNPLILRLYGNATALHPRDEEYHQYINLFPEPSGARQIFVLKVDLVQTSCGYAVPHMQLVKEREALTKWSKKKGEKGIEKYWTDNNQKSIDGFETQIF